MSTAIPVVPGVTHADVPVGGGVSLHVAQAGPADGPVVVLLHGWPQHWWMWRNVMTGLAGAGHRVLAPDLRGFGWSSVPAGGYDKEQLAADVVVALDALGVDRFALAGHDWGGWCAQLIAIEHPDRVSRLAILNIPPVHTPVGLFLRNSWRFGHIALNSLPGIGAGWQRTRAMEHALLGVPKADRATYAERFRDRDRAKAAQRLYRTFLLREAPAGLRAKPRRLHPPMLAIYGASDPVIRPKMIEAFRDLADDVTFEPVPGVGHFVVDERPELVRDALVGWFALQA